MTKTSTAKKTNTGAPTEVRKGRPRLPAETQFAEWLDNLKDVSVEQVAAAAGIAVSSLYHIRRGAQGVSLDVAKRLIDFSDGALTIDSFTSPPQKDSERKIRR